MWTKNLQMFKLRKGRGTRNQIANIHWIIEKAREFQKNIYSVLLNMPKALTVWITTNWKILKEMEIPDHLTYLLRNLYAGQEATVRIGHEQWTSSTLEKEYIKAICCHPAYLTYMQSTSCEMLGWMKHRLESRLWGEISITSDMRWHHFYDRKQRRIKEPLGEGERGQWKSWPKTQHSINKWHSVPSLNGK